MGGITILFSGDFGQMLPVILNSTKANKLNAYIQYSNSLVFFIL